MQFVIEVAWFGTTDPHSPDPNRSRGPLPDAAVIAIKNVSTSRSDPVMPMLTTNVITATSRVSDLSQLIHDKAKPLHKTDF
jgi:hypothetical protein